MGFSNLFKQLRKQLRSKKRWLSLGSVILFAHVAAVGPVSASAPSVSPDALQAIRDSSGQYQVIVKKTYICGEEEQTLGQMDAFAVLKYAKEHPELAPEMPRGNAVLFTQTVDDLSPHCKQSAYFGVDRQGNLTLFDGVPEGERVIRTFFQLNVEHMKSSLPAGVWSQLQGGIRVADMAEFNSVLSTFSDYAAADNQETKQ